MPKQEDNISEVDRLDKGPVTDERIGEAAKQLCLPVLKLALDMQYKLEKNATKPCRDMQLEPGGVRRWDHCPLHWLIKRIRDETEELADELKKRDIDEARLECADIANFAMMVHDNLADCSPDYIRTLEPEPIQEYPLEEVIQESSFTKKPLRKATVELYVVFPSDRYESATYQMFIPPAISNQPDPVLQRTVDLEWLKERLPGGWKGDWNLIKVEKTDLVGEAKE
jgi:hypothetical protein